MKEIMIEVNRVPVKKTVYEKPKFTYEDRYWEIGKLGNRGLGEVFIVRNVEDG